MEDGLIVPGVRHYSPDMRAVLKRIYGEGYHLKADEHGFINTRGEFLSRTEAWKVAEANDQIRRRVGGDEADDGTLYSENLY